MWTNPGISRQKRSVLRKPPTFHSIAPNAKEQAGTPDELEAQDDGNGGDDQNEGQEAEPGQNEAPTPAEGLSREPADVQILDLHSDNPIVSYDGQVYSCEWARNIGTELLFTAHDPESDLPVLRTLPDNVDLLAASSTRIISKPLVLEPKMVKKERSPSEASTRRRRGPESHIPVGYQANSKRKDQAQFLERMMDIKKAKGEKDLVTINVEKRKTNNGWRAHLRQIRQQERSKLQRLLKRGNRTEAFEARRKLDEMNKEDEKLAAEAKARDYGPDGKKLRRPGKPKKTRFSEDGEGSVAQQGTQRGKRARAGALGTSASRLGSGVLEMPSPSSMSMPTPQRWADMEGGDPDDDDYDDEEGPFGEEKETFDEGGPSEDDDTTMQGGWD